MKTLFTILLFASVRIFAQMSGDYYIGDAGTKPGGGDPQFTTLYAACSTLTAQGVSGACTLYFTQSKTYTEATDVYLGPSGTSSSNTITFKPYTGVVCTVDFTSSVLRTGGIDGHFVIGTSDYTTTSSLVATHYVIIDGSNSPGGSSKDLTLQGVSGNYTKSVIRIFGNNDYLTIKNSIIINRSSSGTATAPINLTNFDAANLAPDNCTIQNNTLTSESGNGSAGVNVAQSGSPSVGIANLTIRHNTISARVRGLFITYTNNCDIFNNTIQVNSQASQAASGMSFQTNFAAAGTFNVYNNQITRLRSINATAAANNGIIGIDNQNVSPKVVNIYNNFITGFESTTSTTNSKFYGIRTSSSATVVVYYNTVICPEMTNFTTFGTSYIAGIGYVSTGEASPTAGGSFTVKNNIVIVNETSMKAWGIRRVGTNGTFNSDYNDLYVNTSATNGYVGYFNSTDNLDFANWKSTSSGDNNSKSKAVTFISSTDLHLSGGSVGDGDLAGTPISGYSTDIDGDARHATYPYMGADEAATPLPVELVGLSYKYSAGVVTLLWKTATEVNNYGFEIQKLKVNPSTGLRDPSDENWEIAGFVQGHGNSNSEKSYLFTDGNVASATKYIYRLKQIDTDGKYEYSNEIEVLTGIPDKYSLAQNYPNPFNPSTVISFQLAAAGNVRLVVYDILGKEVEVLVNGRNEAGSHSVDFNASRLQSGIYFYQLTVTGTEGNPLYSATNKMTLIK